ncbi:MAG: putative metal-binding motif-containing protein [Deltaproteobacteria bacterium]|nr:putative metal-binding motif-containing protein [Deltaproteobacteria bacterium]
MDRADKAAQTDVDGDGWSAYDDCDDRDPLRYPQAPEHCDGQDDDCDGQIDEGLHPDEDQDGYGSDLDGACFAGWVPTTGDCDDANPAVHPGLEERCDGRNTGCRAGWTVADEAGLFTWTDAEGAIEDWTAQVSALEPGGVLRLPAVGRLQVCGRADSFLLRVEAEEFEDLQITGRAVELGGALRRPVFNGAASDGAPVLRASSRVGLLEVSGLDLIGGTGGLGVGGAGLSAQGGDMVRLDDVVLRSNLAAREVNGGGGYFEGVGRVELRRVTVQNNVLTGLQRGGGLAVVGGRLLIEDSLIVDNFATEHGGGLYLDGVEATLRRVELRSNRADHGGGGIEVGEGSEVDLFDVIFEENHANTGGALRTEGWTRGFCGDSGGVADPSLRLNTADNQGGAWAVGAEGQLCFAGCAAADNRVLLELGYGGAGYEDGRVGPDNEVPGRAWYRHEGTDLRCTAYECQGDVAELWMNWASIRPPVVISCAEADR